MRTIDRSDPEFVTIGPSSRDESFDVHEVRSNGRVLGLVVMKRGEVPTWEILHEIKRRKERLDSCSR